MKDLTIMNLKLLTAKSAGVTVPLFEIPRYSRCIDSKRVAALFERLRALEKAAHCEIVITRARHEGWTSRVSVHTSVGNSTGTKKKKKRNKPRSRILEQLSV